MNETTTTEGRIVNKDRQTVKSLLQYMTDHYLIGSDEFRAAIKQFNVTTTSVHDRGEFFSTTFRCRYLVDVFSPETIDANPNGVRYEFDTEEQAVAFAAEQRMAGDVPAAAAGTPDERRQQLEGYIIAYLAGESHRIHSRREIAMFVRDAQSTFSLRDEDLQIAVESIMQWQGKRIAARAGK
jgi:hypothetical protein